MTATTKTVADIELNNGITIPQFGLGMLQVPPEETADVVRTALEAGYRHIDTVQIYRNDNGVGDGVKDCGLAREDVLVTTKLANDANGYDNAINALEGSLQRLGTDYVDLYLIHWPLRHKDLYVQTRTSDEDILRALGPGTLHRRLRLPEAARDNGRFSPLSCGYME